MYLQEKSLITTPCSFNKIKVDDSLNVSILNLELTSENVNYNELCIDDPTDNDTLLTLKSAKKRYELSGRRVIEIFTFIDEIQNSLCDHGPFGSTFKDIDLISEIRLGLQSTINFKCKMCGLKNPIKTNNYENAGTININEAAVLGTLSAGGGYSRFSKICSTLDIPVMNPKTYNVYENKVSNNFEKVASNVMMDATMEEKALAIENGDIDRDGVPQLTVICDGSWVKRS